MAQAARLNLRMQKELKLLLTDPPPGASFPLLSGDSDLSSSLSTIDAQIKGPEGTVYAEGVFNIKIQIPERYPFQPPSVTFDTPIYHPNIDNRGRICLDILNLPPKGAWQPSLNISTVLTSIGLLLSEPNPDDGLMCEASREYKYNKQAFDQKARVMTRKYAKVEDKEAKHEANEYGPSHKKLCGISQKLSLGYSGSTLKRDGKVNELPNDHVIASNFENQIEDIVTKKESKGMLNEYNLSHEKLCWTRRRLSLESSGQNQKRGNEGKESVAPNHSKSLLNPQSPPIASSRSLVMHASNSQLHQVQDCVLVNDSINVGSKKPCEVGQKLPLDPLDTCQVSDINNEKVLVIPPLLPSQSHPNVSDKALQMPQAVNQSELQPPNNIIDRMGNGKKLSSVGKRLSLGFKGTSKELEKDNKENIVLIHNLPLSIPQCPSIKCGISRTPSLVPLTQLQGSNNANSKLLLHSENLSTDPSKSLPMQQDSESDEKQQSNKDHNGDIAKEIEQQGTEESPISKMVIVLDSEDSEEESRKPSRSKLLLARKRIGKWKAKA